MWTAANLLIASRDIALWVLQSPSQHFSSSSSCPHGGHDSARVRTPRRRSAPASAAGAAAGDTAAGLAVSANSVLTTLSAALPLSAAPALPLVVTSAVSAEIAVDDAATSAGCAAPPRG
jgi:hypothetical protein